MTKLTEYTSYADAQRHVSSAALWALFDGDRESLNIAHECVDRHAPTGRVAVRVAHADGRDEVVTFRELSAWSSRFAHWLAERGVARGDRVAIMLEPSLAFYAALFGAIKHGAIAVPLFTLFGPDGVRLRVDDCTPRLLVTNAEKLATARSIPDLDVVVADDALVASLARYPERYDVRSAPDELAVFQYTSGTTRELPAAVQHTHRAIVVVMVAALYGTGIRPGDEFFCPSSPAWGHGLWHGTLAPLALGVTTGTMAGKFDPVRLIRALEDYRITNLSAAATHYRMMKSSGEAGAHRYAITKLSFTGEPMDSATRDFVTTTFGTPPCSMYGTTEVGVILADYPGAPDYAVKPGALGKPVPGVRVEVHAPDGQPCPPHTLGEIKVWRRDAWFPTKDRGYVDDDGYFHHAGRADDVIISAGWTMSAVEIEDVLLKHPDVREAAVIGVPDALRGQVVKAFIVSARAADDAFARELQDFTRTRLSQHEYPRHVAFVAELPKTPAGKVNRKSLRDGEPTHAA
ncbi:MAG: AMP-binding protein [Candidatus Rokubacteria bacterium]|nr:AMP-binding protein [Candidatus Rokubacteria bacterium]